MKNYNTFEIYFKEEKNSNVNLIVAVLNGISLFIIALALVFTYYNTPL